MDEQNRHSDDYIIKEENIPLLESLCNDMPGGFFIYNAEGGQEIIFINKAMLRIFGCADEKEFRELTGSSFKGIVHPDDYDKVQKSIEQQIIDSPYSLDYVEYRITRRDGSVRWVQDYGKYISGKDGGLFCVFVEDATDRMRDRMDELERINSELEETTARSNQYHKAILHDAVTFFEINLSKDEIVQTNFKRINKDNIDIFTFMEVPEFTKFSDFINCWVKRMNEKEAEDYRNFFDVGRLISCCENGELKQIFEAPFTELSGKVRFMQFMLLLGKNGAKGDVIALAVIKDITDLSAKQRLLQTALSEANVKNIEKQIALSNISRDLHSPLNSIISYTDMMGYNLSNANILKYCLDKIRAAGNKLIDIVTESLDIPQVKSEMTTLGVSECDLSDLLSDVRLMILPEVSGKQIHFKLDISETKNFNIYAKTVQIEELLWQLLDNAVKFTDKGGSVTLKVSESGDAPKGFGLYTFEVSDTGCGMDADTVKRLLDPYSGEHNGSGLGIAVVKNIADIMKGDFTIESEPEKGSRFAVSLTLPHKSFRDSDDSAEESPVDPMSMAGKRILVVEDDEITREMEQALLESCGYIVDTACDGKKAVKMIKAENAPRYDIILMDIQMPLMNGYEAANAIRHIDDPVISKVPIIAISAEAFETEREKAFKFGINEHFSKPINILELQSSIAKLLNM